MEFIAITNDPRVAKYFEESGIDDIMVDLEIIGKQERQKGLNTVISAHSLEDVSRIKNVLTISKCLVRVNPIHDESEQEIEEAIHRGADILMLPMFKRTEEVENFIKIVDGRAKAYLLLETAAALVRVNDILEISGIDAIHIGLNDLSISMGLDFLYEPLIGGIVEYLGDKITNKNIKFGFGGVSRLDRGKLILSEHYRLGSEMVITNRDFRYYKETYADIVKVVDMRREISKIDKYLETLNSYNEKILMDNRDKLRAEIKNQISRNI